MSDRSCANCIQCEKSKRDDGRDWWVCENYDRGVGMPFDVTPPNDGACSNWTDDPEEKDRPQDELRYFVDHFWDESDDW